MRRRLAADPGPASVGAEEMSLPGHSPAVPENPPSPPLPTLFFSFIASNFRKVSLIKTFDIYIPKLSFKFFDLIF